MAERILDVFVGELCLTVSIFSQEALVFLSGLLAFVYIAFLFIKKMRWFLRFSSQKSSSDKSIKSTAKNNISNYANDEIKSEIAGIGTAKSATDSIGPSNDPINRERFNVVQTAKSSPCSSCLSRRGCPILHTKGGELQSEDCASYSG